MKNQILLLSFIIISSLVFAQTPPDAFNYTGAVRDASGNPISNKTISTELSILQNSENGTLVYRERHTVTTDKFGVFNCSVGQGSIQEGTFNSINWGSSSYFLKVALDIEGGNNYNVLGSTQLLSVPYALYAKKSSDNVIPVINSGKNISITGQGTQGDPYVINNEAGFTRYIGEEFGGGVIFHLWKDVDGMEHGLIVTNIDPFISATWSNITTLPVGLAARSSWNGQNNSNEIVAQAGHTRSAAQYCLELVIGGQDDWYLPAIDELSMLWQNRFEVNKTLSRISGANEINFVFPYWSSTERGNNNTLLFNFSTGSSEIVTKGTSGYIRAIRKF